jgi:hypothetical protein
MSAEMANTINAVSLALHKVAESKTVASVKHELHDAADAIQHKMEAWHEAVDAWVQHELPNLDAARRAAFVAFKEELAKGRALLERHRV